MFLGNRYVYTERDPPVTSGNPLRDTATRSRGFRLDFNGRVRWSAAGLYVSAEAMNEPCQVWYQTWPVFALTDSMPVICASFAMCSV